ncbi:MAG TPA: zinc ribbon domain-containing protein [Burkholderiaceae bacterium]|nr:zinc ribbon domain-containing protein [Burkholderiaceae bacterium]
MPIYAYKCAECGHELDVIRKVSDPPLTECPQCTKPALVKQVTAAGFQLKGAGWYVTDFRDQGKKKEKGKPEEPSKTEAADAKTEAKSDTKTEATDSKGATETKTESKSDGVVKPAPAPAASPPPPAGGKSSESG